MASKTNNYTGVSFDRQRNKFRAYVYMNGRQIVLGVYNNELEAVKARDDFLSYANLGISLNTLARNKKRIDRFELILKSCVEQKNSSMMAEILEKNQETIKNDMDILHAFGYLAKEVVVYGKYNQNSNFYRTVKLAFNPTDLAGILEHVAKEKKRVRVPKSNKPTIEGARLYTTEMLSDKIRQQTAQARREYKSAKTFVSGTSLGDIF